MQFAQLLLVDRAGRLRQQVLRALGLGEGNHVADRLGLGHQRDEAVEAKWLKLGTVPDSLRHPQCYERYLPINAWYAEHPQFCIGRIRRESNGY